MKETIIQFSHSPTLIAFLNRFTMVINEKLKRAPNIKVSITMVYNIANAILSGVNERLQRGGTMISQSTSLGRRATMKPRIRP